MSKHIENVANKLDNSNWSNIPKIAMTESGRVMEDSIKREDEKSLQGVYQNIMNTEFYDFDVEEIQTITFPKVKKYGDVKLSFKISAKLFD